MAGTKEMWALLFLGFQSVCCLTINENNCHKGWFGRDCQEPCSPQCSFSTCVRDTGDCIGPCEQGYFGHRCDKICNRNCRGGCDKLTGKCKLCGIHSFGTFCEKECSLACNPRITNCSNNICDRDTGYCLCGCGEKRFGEKCDFNCLPHCLKCESDHFCNYCDQQYWGTRCERNCPSDCVYQECDKDSGKCIDCDGTKAGDMCNEICPLNCVNGLCHQNGTCVRGCKNMEFYGDHCNMPCNGLKNIPNCTKCAQSSTGAVQCKLCANGKYGNACDLQCPENCLECKDAMTCTLCKVAFTGPTCANECLVPDCSECSIDGTCLLCNPGIFGHNCEFRCPHCKTCVLDETSAVNFTCLTCEAGQYLFSDRNVCLACNENCKTCVDGKSCTSCKDGYFGRTCSFQCPSSCQTCDSESNCSSCRDGLIGSSCQCNNKNCLTDRDQSKWCGEDGHCLKGCRNGYFGDRCTYSCLDNCATCDQKTGKCSQCVPGRFGMTCEVNCSANCAQKDATGVSVCSIQEGSCLYCDHGWYGLTCESKCNQNCLTYEGSFGCTANGTCQKCTGNKYGLFCELECAKNCYSYLSESSCNKKSGKCVGCKDGFSGDFCCPRNCLECTSDTQCIKCSRGLTGEFCDKNCSITGCIECDMNDQCQVCKPGKYGKNCEYTCPECTTCISDNTTYNNAICLTCQKGKYVSLDTRKCENCSENCESCFNENNCTSCKDGFYGQTCSKPCPASCQTCLSDTDCRSCKEGRTGSSCQCSSKSCMGQSMVCTPEDKCVSGCGDDHVDKYCQFNCVDGCMACEQKSAKCLECTAGKYGSECKQTCDENCALNSSTFDGAPLCHIETGACFACLNGWYGPTCEFACNRHCLNLGGVYSCHRNGSCDNCIDNTYGPSCELNCSEHCYASNQMNSCEKNTGRCVNCRDGFYGELCNVSCGEECQTLCDRTSGHCESSVGTATVGGVAGIIAAAAVIIVLSLVLIFIIIKRRGYFHYKLKKLPKIKFRRRTDNVDNTFFGALGSLENDDEDKRRRTYQSLETIYDTVKDTDIDDSETSKTIASSYDMISLVPVSKFVHYVRGKQATNSDWFKEEFNGLPLGLLKPCTVAKAPVNSRKCRYRDIYPYDDNRVILATDDTGSGDFINASYIKGYQKNKKFIAAEGPSEKTVSDFWAMIWQGSCESVVMLTNLYEDGLGKCIKHWPDEKIPKQYGKLDIILVGEDLFADYIVRTLKVVHKTSGEVKDVKHFHFTAWPDKGVPYSVGSLLLFRDQVNKLDGTPDSPMLVHCSSGVGRSGTFIVLDYLLRQAQTEPTLSVFRLVADFMYQRTSFVQTDVQYEFIHEALFEWLTSSKTGNVYAVTGNYYCGLLKNKGQLVPGKRYEKHYEFIDDAITKGPQAAANATTSKEDNHYYRGLLKEKSESEYPSKPKAEYEAVTESIDTPGKAILVSKDEPENASKIQSKDIANLDNQNEPGTYTYTQLKEKYNSMYLTCFEEPKK